MSALLLDTGPLVALLDSSDHAHRFVDKRLGDRRGHIVTTGAIVTEAMFRLHDVRRGPERLVQFLEDVHADVLDMFDNSSLRAAVVLMEDYRDTPMDFADATLVVLAERLGCPDILTLDERGFRTFRFGRNRRFHLVLQDSAN